MAALSMKSATAVAAVVRVMRRIVITTFIVLRGCWLMVSSLVF